MNSFKNNTPKIDGISLNILLRQTVDALHKIRENELKNLDITPEQAAALMCIKTIGEKATVAELSRWLFRKRNTTSIIVKRLEKQGLIRKTPLRTKNSMRLFLTVKGNRICNQVAKFSSIQDIINVIPSEEQEMLWMILHILRDRAVADLHMDVEYYSPLFDKVSLSISPAGEFLK
jgi:DNA-binding MarR family transcriptional regulator